LTNGIITLCHMIMSSKNNRKSKKHTLLCKIKSRNYPSSHCPREQKHMSKPNQKANVATFKGILPLNPLHGHVHLCFQTPPATTHPHHSPSIPLPKIPSTPQMKFFLKKNLIFFSLFLGRYIIITAFFFLVKGWKTKGIVMRCYEK